MSRADRLLFSALIGRICALSASDAVGKRNQHDQCDKAGIILPVASRLVP